MSEVTTPAQVTPQAGTGNQPTPAAAAPQEAAPAGVKQEQPVPATPALPEKYELKLPEGSQLNAAHLEKIASFAKERGLSQEQAQAVVDRENLTISEFIEANSPQKMADAWAQQASQDQEIGGQAFKQNAEIAKRVINRFGSDALKKALNDTGLGNHPELVRAFVRIGKVMSEDQLVLPGTHGSGGKKAIEDIFYGKTGE